MQSGGYPGGMPGGMYRPPPPGAPSNPTMPPGMQAHPMQPPGSGIPPNPAMPLGSAMPPGSAMPNAPGVLVIGVINERYKRTVVFYFISTTVADGSLHFLGGMMKQPGPSQSFQNGQQGDRINQVGLLFLGFWYFMTVFISQI